MLSFTGCNGFGPFAHNSEQNFYHFQEISMDPTFPVNDRLLASATWSYVVFAVDNEILIQGFITDSPNQQMRLTAPGQIKQIGTVDRHCLVLLHNGKLFKCKPRRNTLFREIKMAVEQPTWKEPETYPITHVACGSKIAVAINSINEVFNIPSKVHQFPKHFNVKRLLCGFEHALLLSGNGDVYAWGHGMRGQLGQEQLEVEEAPVLVEPLAGIKITEIAAGGWLSAAISAFGDLYTWGFNSHGQLGLRIYNVANKFAKEPSVYPLPTLIDIPICCPNENCDALKVFAGARHMILQMTCGTLFGTGWNAYGQLGFKHEEEIRDDNDYVDTLTKLPIAKEDVQSGMQVYCGHWCTIIRRP